MLLHWEYIENMSNLVQNFDPMTFKQCANTMPGLLLSATRAASFLGLPRYPVFDHLVNDVNVDMKGEDPGCNTSYRSHALLGAAHLKL